MKINKSSPIFITIAIIAILIFLQPPSLTLAQIEEDMTIQEFYDAVRTEIARLEAEKIKLQKARRFLEVTAIDDQIKILREGLGVSEFIVNPEESRGLKPDANPAVRQKQLEALERELTDEMARLKQREAALNRTVPKRLLPTRIEPIHEQLARADGLLKFIQKNKQSLVNAPPEQWRHFISPRSLIVYLKEHGIPFQQLLEALARFMKETKGGIDLVRMGELIKGGARIGLEVGKGFLRDLPYLLPLEAADIVRKSSQRVISYGELLTIKESLERQLDYFRGFKTSSGQDVTPIRNPQVFNLTLEQVGELKRRKFSIENQLRILDRLIKEAEQKLGLWDWLFYGVRRPSILEEQQRAERVREEMRNIPELRGGP